MIGKQANHAKIKLKQKLCKNRQKTCKCFAKAFSISNPLSNDTQFKKIKYRIAGQTSFLATVRVDFILCNTWLFYVSPLIMYPDVEETMLSLVWNTVTYRNKILYTLEFFKNPIWYHNYLFFYSHFLLFPENFQKTNPCQSQHIRLIYQIV